MVHKHRDNLTGEHDISDIGQLILFCLFIALWISDIFLEYSNFLNGYIPIIVRLPIGIVLIVISGYTAVASLYLLFGKVNKPTGIVREGIFRLFATQYI